MNPFDELDGVLLPGPALTARRPTLVERIKGNYEAGYWGGTLFGAVQGAYARKFEKNRAMAAYETMPQWETPLEGLAALAGQVAGGASSIENYTPPGLGEKAIAWTGMKLPAVAARFFAGAIDAGVVNALTDTGVQTIEMGHGQRDQFSPTELASSTAIGALVGGAAGTVAGLFRGADAPPALDLAPLEGLGQTATPPMRPPMQPAHMAPQPVTPQPLTMSGEATGQMVAPRNVAAETPALGDTLDATAREVRGLPPRPDVPVIEVKGPRRAGGIDSRPLNVMEFIASQGGLRDDAGELTARGLNARNTMTKFGPAFRKPGEQLGPDMLGGQSRVTGNGLSPDQMRERLVQAGYLNDTGWETGKQASTAASDVYGLIDRQLNGETVVSQHDLPQQIALEENRKAQLANAEFNDRYSPAEQELILAHGEKAGVAMARFFEETGMKPGDWQPDDMRLAAGLIADGMPADHAFERAAMMQVAGDFQALTPEAQQLAHDYDLNDIPGWETQNGPQGQGGPHDGSGAGHAADASGTGSQGLSVAERSQADTGGAAAGSPRQSAIPGTEPLSPAAQAQRMADRPLRAEVPQNFVMDHGLFGDSMNQKELFASAPPGTGALKRAAGGTAAQVDNPAFTRVQDISEKLAKALDATAVRPGHVWAKVQHKSAAGQYHSGSGVIRIKRPDDFDTLTHELGHHLENAIGQPVKDLMQAHAAELEPMAYAGAKKGNDLKEGFAEFVRLFVTNPAYAQKTAPKFHAAFSGLLAKDHPDVAAAMAEAGRAWRDWLAQPSADAVASTIVSAKKPGMIETWRKEMGQAGLGGTILEHLQAFYGQAFDELHPITRAVRMLAKTYRDNHGGKLLDLTVDQNAAQLARMATHSYGAGHADIVKGVVPYGDFTPQGPSLRDALVTAMGKPNALSGWDDGMMRRFGAYLWSRRALGEWDRFEAGLIANKPDKLTKGDHAVNIAESEKAFPAFAPAAKMVHDWATALWTKKRDAGLITAEQWADGMAITDYVPGLRARDAAGDAVGSTPGKKSASVKGGQVKQFKGSNRDVINPVDSLIRDAYDTAAAIARNDTVKALANLAELAGPGAGAIAEKVPAKAMRGMDVDPLEALAKAAKEQGLAEDEWLTLRDAVEAMVGDDKVTLFRPAIINEKGEPIAFYREAGQLKALRLADGEFGKQMFNAMAGFTPQQKSLLMGLLTKPAAISRLGVVLEPVFVLKNWLRDMMTTVVYYGKPFARLANTARGFMDEVGQREGARIYNQFGGVSGGAFSQATHEMRMNRDINSLKSMGWDVAQFTSLHGWMQAAEVSESAMRLGLLRTFRDEAKARGLSDTQALLEAAWRARDHQDFGRRGSRMAALSRIVPFLNASLQGTDKFARHMVVPFLREALTEADVRARGVAVKAWARLSMAVVAYLGYHAMMREDDTYADNQPLRARNFLIRWGDKFAVIPKPFELSIFFNGAEAAYDAWAKNDPRAAASFTDALMVATLPPDIMLGNPTIKTAFELRTGKDIYTGADVMPDAVKGLEPTLQYTARTGELAKVIGGALNLPPVWVEQVMLNYSTSLGRAASSLYDYAASDKPAPGWDDAVITQGFIKDGSRGASSTRAFWQLVGTRTGTLEGARKSYQAFMDQGDPKAAADYLAQQEPMVRDWIAAGAIKADARRIHPFARAQLAATAINALRREMSQDMIATADGKQAVPRPDRGAADDILSHLAMTMARNALVMMKVPGWADRKVMDETGYYRELAAASPVVAQALADRFASAHVLPQGDMLTLWPELQARLAKDGSSAMVMDLAARAKAAGTEGHGSKIKKAPRALVPGG